jgi:DNA-binding helix-hairpin-helix protein with protein kinase domain
MSELLIPLQLRARGVSLRLDSSLELGAGGEARVFALPGDRERVAKIYRQPSDERARKIERMIAAPPVLGPDPEGAVRLAWPREVVVDEEGRAVGFLMPRADGPRIFEFYNPVTRRSRAPLFHYALLHRAGANLAAAFDALHQRGYVVGDVNESNILVAPDGAVTLVDTDGFQVPDPAHGTFRSRVGRPEFTPPELQGMTFGAVDRTPAHDRFGLGVLLFLLLMEGTHPFAVRIAGGVSEAPPLEGRIRAGMFPHAGSRPPRVGCMPPRLGLPFEVLHPALRALFERCFVDGHLDPSARPAAHEWRAALVEAEGELRRCDLNVQHRFGTHLGDCPWCARARLLRGRDPFPATAEDARRVAPHLPAPVPPVSIPAPLLRPRRQAAPAHRAPVLAALRTSMADPAAWVFPLLFLALLPLGGVQFIAALAALAAAVVAMQPRSATRNWGHVVAAALFLTFTVGVAADVTTSRGDSVTARITPPPFADLNNTEAMPVLANGELIERLMTEAYPPALYDTGRGGTVLASFRVEEDGSTDPSTITVVESDEPQLEPVVRQIIPMLRFTPATVKGRPVKILVQMPFYFDPDRAVP